MKLQPLLNDYFYANGNLPIAGTGHISIQYKSAQFGADQTSLNAPTNDLLFQQYNAEKGEEQLTPFISKQLQVSLDHTKILIEKEGRLEVQFAEKDVFDWPSLGTFMKGADGEIFFQQDKTLQQYLPSISLIPIQQEEPIETEEILEVENELLQEHVEPVQQNRWWIAAGIIFIVSLLLILFHYLSRN